MVFKKILKMLKRAFKTRVIFSAKKSKRRKFGSKKRSSRRVTLKHKKKSRARVIKKIVRRKKHKTRKVSKAPKKIVTRHPDVRHQKKTNKNDISQKSSLNQIGLITHFFPKVNAAVVKLKKPMCIGDPIWVKGHVTDFRQTVGSMQIDRKPIERGRAGQEIGLEVFKEVRPGDLVFVSAKK